jgi:hypothetical protein
METALKFNLQSFSFSSNSEEQLYENSYHLANYSLDASMTIKWRDIPASDAQDGRSQLVQLWRHASHPPMATLGLRQAPLLIVHVVLPTLLYLAPISALASSPISP